MTKFIIATIALILACAIIVLILALAVSTLELLLGKNEFEKFQKEISKIAKGERFTCLIYEGMYSVTFQDLNVTILGTSIKDVIKEVKKVI